MVPLLPLVCAKPKQVGSVSDVLIFQNKLLKTLPIAEERKNKEHN
jgi:hypothetical protein